MELAPFRQLLLSFSFLLTKSKVSLGAYTELAPFRPPSSLPAANKNPRQELALRLVLRESIEQLRECLLFSRRSCSKEPRTAPTFISQPRLARVHLDRSGCETTPLLVFLVITELLTSQVRRTRPQCTCKTVSFPFHSVCVSVMARATQHSAVQRASLG